MSTTSGATTSDTRLHELSYDGPGGSGTEMIDAKRAGRIAALFSGPPDGEALRKEFYDRAGFCSDCGVFYCEEHWSVSPIGYGKCPKGHGQSLDPHWSPPNWADDDNDGWG